MLYAQRSHARLAVALAIVAAVFLIVSVPRYLTGDAALSRVPVAASFGAHYPLLVAHVVFGSIAMVSGLAQVWPLLRATRSALHRVIGRVYVFAGVLPAGGCGLVIGAASPFGPILAASDVFLALCWLGVTLAGYRSARQGRFGQHRRWMIRSVVLTFSIISNRIWAVLLYFALTPLRDVVFDGDEQLFGWVLSGLTGWLGWTIPLLGAEYWLRRRRLPRDRQVDPTAAV